MKKSNLYILVKRAQTQQHGRLFKEEFYAKFTYSFNPAKVKEMVYEEIENDDSDDIFPVYTKECRGLAANEGVDQDTDDDIEEDYLDFEDICDEESQQDIYIDTGIAVDKLKNDES